MRNRILISSIVAVAALSGCSSGQATQEPDAERAAEASSGAAQDTGSPTAASEPVEPSPTPSPTEDAQVSARGNLLKGEGEGHGLTTEADGVIATVTVNSVTPAACDASYWEGAENGQIVRVNLTTEIGTSETAKEVTWRMGNPHSWRVYSADDSRVPSPATQGSFTCMSSHSAAMPTDLVAGDKITGDIFLDVATDTGTLAWETPNPDLAMEWNYDATK